jgi:hypothetical protein
MQPESSDGFASVGTILPEGRAALLPGGSFRFYLGSSPGLFRANEPSDQHPTNSGCPILATPLSLSLGWGNLNSQSAPFINSSPSPFSLTHRVHRWLSPLLTAYFAEPGIGRLCVFQGWVYSAACGTSWRFVLRNLDAQIVENILRNWLRRNLLRLLELVGAHGHSRSPYSHPSARQLIPAVDSCLFQHRANSQRLFRCLALAEKCLPSEFSRPTIFVPNFFGRINLLAAVVVA